MNALGGLVLIVTIFTIGMFVYFLPCVVAGSRKHPNQSAIFVVNLFLGWTLIGWVVALAWSLTVSGNQNQKVKA